MLGSSTAEYIWVKWWVFILHSIAPFCVAYYIATVLLHPSLLLPKPFELWALAEVVFYFFTFLYQRLYLQRPCLHPPPPPKEERQRLFDLCQDTTQDLEHYLSKWFLGAPYAAIKRENIKEWLRWAFLNTAIDDPAYDDEVEGYVKQLEMRSGIKFEPGRADLKCLRLTLDPVQALHRSLTWYMCIFVVDIITHAYMIFHSFQFYRSSIKRCLSILPLRPQALLASHHSPVDDLTYWYRPHTSHKELPILFLHGIGVGLYPYMQFLDEINQGRSREEGSIGILAIEILPISSRITSPLLRKAEMCRQLAIILRHHGTRKFALVSHSYGSVITTHLLKVPEIASQISSIILIDPISILLHQPDVAYNFTVRRPRFANEWLLWYFGSKDMGVAHTLSRAFFWSENILWKEELTKHHATVFLSAKDSIINAPSVRTYLQPELGDGWQQDSQRIGTSEGDDMRSATPKADARLNVVWCSDLDHGQIFDFAVWRGRLKSEVLMQVRAGEVER